jgi:ElaA protein
MTPTVQSARFTELDVATLYELLRLRVEIFVVEQKCAYPELDGRDTEPETVHLWAADRGEVVGYLRILVEPDGSARIGRVAVVPPARGTGLAGRLMVEALEHIAGRPCVLDAQTYLAGFYSRLGFTVTGPEFLEDGIPHVPMRREPSG